MARTSSLTNVATVTRATSAWYPGGWDFTSGGAITGSLVEYANNIPRDGAQGLLVEESSTNQLRNPRGEGATGTTAPTNWSVAVGGTTINYTATTFNGWPATRVAITGTASGAIQILFDGTTVVSAASGEDWTLSTGVILESGTLPTTLEAVIQERSAGGSLLAATNDAITPTGSHKRFVTSRTFSDGSTAYVSAGIRFPSVSGSVSCTLLILTPQLEQKAHPTSPILPPASSPAASTRNADQVDIAETAWAADEAGTFYANVDMTIPQGLGFTRYIIGGSGTSRYIYYSGQGASFFDGVSVTAAPNTVIKAAGDNLRVASAFDASGNVSITADFSASVGTATGGNVTNLKLSTPGGIGIGARYTTGVDGGFYIKEFRYWPRKLTDNELTALVGN